MSESVKPFIHDHRRYAVLAFARKLRDEMFPAMDNQTEHQLAGKLYEFVGQYESGLEAMNKQWEKIAHDAINASLSPQIFVGAASDKQGER